MLRLLAFGLHLALWGLALWSWGRIPDTVPVHFGADGAPDRWGPASATNWFTLPGIGLLLNLLMLAATRWLGADPRRVKVAGGRTADELPDAQRDGVVQTTIGTLLLVQIVTNLMFLAIQGAQYRTALGADASAWIQTVLLGGLLSGPVLIVAHFVRLRRSIAGAATGRPAR